MLSAKENELLTHVGPGTPMGEFLRRFWLPALLSDELPQADGDPIRTRTLGEDLVAFRDSNGQVGIVDALCPHPARRCTSAATRNAVSAASTTAGSSTPPASASTCRASRPNRTSRSA